MAATLRPEMLEKLLDVSRQMAEKRELDTLLNYAMIVAMELVNAEMGYLILLEEGNNLDFRVKLRRDGQPVERPIEQISHSILSQVVFDQEDVMVADAIKEDVYQDADSVFSLVLRSVMAVPLISRENLLGALYVENRSETGVFATDDLKILKFFASQAAVAIENALLNDDLETRVAARTAEIQQANEQLQNNWHDAIEYNRIRNSFLSTISHDIRAPLSTSINVHALLLEGVFGEINDEQAQWISTSLETLNHIVKLTDDIFDLTKIEMNKLTLYPERVDLRAFLRQIYDIGLVLRWDENVKFQLDLPDDLPAQAEIDPTRIRQVIMNLITNAHKFTEQGVVTLYARGGADQTLIFGVRDTGAGIAEDDMNTIFERYKQSGTRQMRQQGTGLGLAITQEIVHLHSGEIHVRSELGVGSDFRVTLPL